MLWVVNMIAYIINLVIVGGSQFGWFGSTNDEVSDEYPTLITPDGWAFSIWFVIFVSELIFIVWGALPANRDIRVLNEGVGCWFAIACVLQAGWSITFARESLIGSAVLLCGIAFSLGMAVVSLTPFKMEQRILFISAPFWTVHFPIGLHGGWTLAAALVNINLALELDNVSSEIAALLLSIVGASFGASVAAIVFYDQVYLLAVAWAIAGIASKQDYRLERLGKPVADGVTEGLNALWLAVICVGVLGFFASVRQRNRTALENEEKGYAASTGTRRAPGGNDLTRAIFSS